jgi:hypothetical protein
MNFELITRNNITPNPSVELIELCNLAINVANDNAFAAILLDAKYKELCTDDSLLTLDKHWAFGTLVITIQHGTRGGDMQHRFCTHYDTTKECTGTELSPVMYAY